MTWRAFRRLQQQVKTIREGETNRTLNNVQYNMYFVLRIYTIYSLWGSQLLTI